MQAGLRQAAHGETARGTRHVGQSRTDDGGCDFGEERKKPLWQLLVLGAESPAAGEGVSCPWGDLVGSRGVRVEGTVQGWEGGKVSCSLSGARLARRLPRIQLFHFHLQGFL